MRILTFTTLYPNAANPNHGVFVENRLVAARDTGGAECKVIAPIPWFPSRASVFARYARFAAAPAFEERCGIEIRHPRYFLPPRIGMTYAASSLARAGLRAARELIAEGWDFDVIDAHYLYPDGVAAIRIGAALDKPVVLTARGSDVTLLPKYPRQRKMILDALFRADAIIAVADALKKELVLLGAPAEKIEVLRNGVDLDRFRPLDRDAIRQRLKLSGPVIASVGSLIARKGHDIAIRAVAEIDGAALLVAGEGPERGALERLAQDLGVLERTKFLGAVAHEALPEIYNGADALVLASAGEGWANVLLEAMACGTPAITSNVGGNAEVVADPCAGRIVDDRTPKAFAKAIGEMISRSSRTSVRDFAQTRSWDKTAAGVNAIFSRISARKKLNRTISYAPVLKEHREKPALLFTVDTEEEFDWAELAPSNHRISKTKDIDRLQQLCASHGVKPLYFITYPLLRNEETAAYFRALYEAGAADLGIHPHQWNIPSTDGFKGDYYSWQGNLPPEIHLEKLAAMKQAFEDAFGFSPRAHRAGRYGITPGAIRELVEIGITHDFSPSPGFDFSAAGGPDFSGVSNDPFVARTDRGDLFVTPVCGAWSVRGGRTFLSQKSAPGLTSTPRRAPPTLFAPFRLTCEQARFSELQSLTRSLQHDGASILTFSLHSTTMTPGGNPYSPDAAATDRALALIGRYLEFFTKDFQGELIDFQGLKALTGGD